MTRNVGLFPSLLHFPVARSPTRTPSPSLSLYFFLSPSPSTSPSPVRSILLATLLDISGAHACNEIRMPRALAEPGHTPIREDELWALEETSTIPVLLPPTFPILPLLLPSRHGRFASRHEKVAVDILSLSKFLHCSVSHRYFFPQIPLRR